MHASSQADPAGKSITLFPKREVKDMNHRGLRDIHAIHEAIDEDRSLRKKKKTTKIKFSKPNIFFRPKKPKKPKKKKPKKPKTPKTKTSSKSKSPQCDESTHVITATISVTGDGKKVEKKIKKIAKKAGKALDELDYWTTFCTNQELVPVVVARRLTAVFDSDGRRLQSTTFNAFFYGETNDPERLESEINEEVKDTIEEADDTINSVDDVDTSPIQSVPIRQRRTRRLHVLSRFNNAESTLLNSYGIEDEIDAANEEWRDLNIAAISPISSIHAKIGPSNHANNKLHVSPFHSKFEIIPFFRGSEQVLAKVLLEKDDTISIATQTDASLNRLARLLQMSERWDGYISVAIYGKKVDEKTVRSKVELFWRESAKHLEGKVIIHLVIDGRKPGDDGDTDLYYPHNVLRNIAMENAPTDLVFNNDVDFIPSVDSHAMLLQHLSSVPRDQPSVMILPAFERKLFDGEDEAQIIAQDIPFSKANLLKQLDANFERITPFHERYPSGHGSTNYPKWYKSIEPYQVDFALDYEPYFVINKKKWDAPPFWEHFTGFGKNKQAWVEELALAGFHFYVCPDAFIVHIDHSVDGQDEVDR